MNGSVLVGVAAVLTTGISPMGNIPVTATETSNVSEKATNMEFVQNFIQKYCSEKIDSPEEEYILITEVNDKNYQQILDGEKVYLDLEEDIKKEIADEYKLKNPQGSYENLVQEAREKKEKLDWSEKSLEATVDGTKIRVSGMLPEEATLQVNKVMPSIENQEVIVAFDLEVLDKDGQTVDVTEDNLSVEVLTSAFENETCNVYYVSPEGKAQSVQVSNQEGISLTFEVSHFSIYAISKPVEIKEANMVDPAIKLDKVEPAIKVDVKKPILKPAVEAYMKPNVNLQQSIQPVEEKKNELPEAKHKFNGAISSVQEKKDLDSRSKDVQVQQFIKQYVSDGQGVVYDKATESNYRQIISGLSSWNQLSLDQKKEVNEELIRKVNKSYNLLLQESQRVQFHADPLPEKKPSISTGVQGFQGLYGMLSALSVGIFSYLISKYKHL